MELKTLEEHEITRIIVEETLEDWKNLTNVDVAIVGAGPSGLVAGKYLAEKGLRTVIFERRLSFGGGIGGGGMLFHKVVVASPADNILREIGCHLKQVSPGVYVVDTADMMAKLASAAVNAGAKIIFGVTVEDVVFRDNPLRITGVVIQWSAVLLAQLHVDPLAITTKAVIDATGHDAEVLTIVSKKIPEFNLKIPYEKSMYAPLGERLVVEKTGEILPGLYATGMAVASIYNLPRMGPIFSSMLLSGKKVAEEVYKAIKG
ncbi:MAG: sulfide-dependent adenosine diphosphate thiazole synthase [Candidatus Njordarchaeales archaeon]